MRLLIIFSFTFPFVRSPSELLSQFYSILISVFRPATRPATLPTYWTAMPKAKEDGSWHCGRLSGSIRSGREEPASTQAQKLQDMHPLKPRHRSHQRRGTNGVGVAEPTENQRWPRVCAREGRLVLREDDVFGSQGKDSGRSCRCICRCRWQILTEF